jgi:hypothetical protein
MKGFSVMRKIILLFSCALLLNYSFTSNVSAGFPANQSMGMSAGKGGMLPMPTEAEMKEIEQFLSTLSEEELEELAKLGEEIMKTAEQEGVPLFDPTPQKKPVSQPTPKPQAPTVQKPVISKAKETKTATDQKKIKIARKLLIDFIKTIDDIRQKAASEEELDDTFSPFDQPLNTLLYYLHVINDDRIIEYLIQPEFSSLYNLVKRTFEDLDTLNNQFDIPMTNSSRVECDINELKKAKKYLQRIKERFSQAFFQDQLNEELERIIKKHEPEALRIKKELEAKEQQAISRQQKKAGASGTTQSPQHQFAAPQPPMRGPAQPQPSAPKSQPKTTPLKTAQTKPTTEAKKTEPKKPTPPKPKATTDDLEKGIHEELTKIENTIAPYEATLHNFLNDYSNSKQETDPIKKPLSDVNFELKKLKKTANKWYEVLEQEANSNSELKAKTKNMNESFNSIKYRKLKGLHNKTKDLVTNKVPLENEIKNFKESMDAIEKKLS